MTWKQLDTLAVAGDQPLDAFVGLGIEGNVQAAHAARLRRWGMTWPADERPIVGCHMQLAWMLGVHPLTEGATELTITVQLDVDDADVYIAAGVRSAQGWTQTDEITVTPGGVVFQDIEIDVSSHRGICVVFLLVRSAVGANFGTTGVINGTRFGHLWVDLTGAFGGMVFLSTQRYMMTVTDPPATSLQLGTDPRPQPRTVIHRNVGGNGRIYAWPPVTPGRNFESVGDYEITFDLLGRATLHGYDVVETAVRPLGSLVERLTGGNLPAFDAFGALYQRGYDIATKRTRVYGAGPTLKRSSIYVDAYTDNFTHWGATTWAMPVYHDIPVLGLPERYLSSVTVGNTGDDARWTGPRSAVTTTYRTQYRAVAALVFGWRHTPVQFDWHAKIQLASFSAVTQDWTDSIVETEVSQTSTTVWSSNFTTDAQAPLLGFRLDEGVNYHALRGAWLVDEIQAPHMGGIRLVEFAINDTAPSTKRQARLLVRTDSSQARNGETIAYSTLPERDSNVQMYCPSMCIYTQEGF